MRDAKIEARVRLSLVQGLGPVLTRRLEERMGGPEAVLEASVGSLAEVQGIGLKKSELIRRELDESGPRAEAEWAAIQKLGLHLLSLEDEGYPPLLRHIPDPPPLLYVRGRLERQDSVGLGIVGSRDCTNYGREQADRFAAYCSQAGMTIISGGARGIDSAAHRAAVKLGRRTIAVVGCGLAHDYPPENRELFEQIATCGAVVSEMPTGMPPIAENFPRRNRIISGLSLGVLVVEASARSGALITARLAAEEHGREVMAIPGRVDSPASAGCHKILREGWATLVTSGADVLDALGETGQALLRGVHDAAPAGGQGGAGLFDAGAGAAGFAGGGAGDSAAGGAAGGLSVKESGLNDEQRAVLEAIGTNPISLESVSHRTGLAISRIQAHLTVLQLRGLVERAGGNQVRRRG